MSEIHDQLVQPNRRFSDGHWWQWDGQRWVMEPEAPAPGTLIEQPPPPPSASSSSRAPIIAVIVGLALVLLAALTAAGIFMAKKSADDQAAQQAAQEAAQAVAADTAAKARVLQTAAEGCSVADVAGVTIGDGGRTLTLDGQGAEESSGVNVSQTVCVLMAVNTPDAVISRMDSTRALDGTQTATWDNITATWTYHPDNGLDVILTTTTE